MKAAQKRIKGVDNMNLIGGTENIREFNEKPSFYFIFCGRAPSGSLHIGHLVSYRIAIQIQRNLRLPVIFQIADREKNVTFEESLDEIARQILSLGFDPETTFFVSDTLSEGLFMEKRDLFLNKFRLKDLEYVFGSLGAKHAGFVLTIAIQASIAASSEELLGERKDCLVVCGEDQIPYFKLARRVFDKRISLIINSYYLVEDGKMSSSSKKDQIPLFEDVEVEKIVGRIPSKGGATLGEHRKFGGDPKCPVLKNLLLFLGEPEGEFFKKGYLKGTLSSSDLKKELSQKILEAIDQVRERKRSLFFDPKWIKS